MPAYAIVIRKSTRYFVYVRGLDGVYVQSAYCPARGYGSAVDAIRAAFDMNTRREENEAWRNFDEKKS